MDIDKVRTLTDAELYEELGTQRRHLYDLRFQLATRQLTDHSQLTQTRRSIARILTVMTERSLDESAPPVAPEKGRRQTAASGRGGKR
ncbi:MAG TPA: 50S ribosomal protein L29 [Aestuariivirgaceae bacterium]|jgi:large subunit ribosomal protein L29|nr:50S ribosomal protein L29 [Aestuariivirgaceae bacterium]